MPQLIESEGTFNFRDFGGYATSSGRRVRSGMLFRAASLDKIDDAEARSLQDRLSIQTIIDLRHPDEFRDNPGRGSLVDLVPNRHELSPIEASQPIKNHTEALNTIHGIGQSGPRYFEALERGESVWREVVRVLLELASYPILAHCTAGKDRTGTAAGLLLDLLGVAKDDVSADYAKSSASVDQLYDYIIEAGRRPEGSMEESKARMVTHREYMADFLTLLYEKYGNAEGYIKHLGFGSNEIARVREFLLE